MGMKVAAVSLMCQDERVFAAMEMAGTPCPFEGKIGQEAATAWEAHAQERPDYEAYTKKIEGREAKVIAAQQEIAKEKQNEVDAWIKACKRTKHTAGKHKGVHKSGRTCRKEWADLNS